MDDSTIPPNGTEQNPGNSTEKPADNPKNLMDDSDRTPTIASDETNAEMPASEESISDGPNAQTSEDMSTDGSTSDTTSTDISEGPDPYNLSELWAPVPLVQTRTQMTTIRAATRPPKDKFIRVMKFDTGDGSDVSAYVNCRPVYLFEYTFDGDMSPKSYYVRPGTEVANVLAEKQRLTEALLVLGVVRHGDPFIWELKIPNGRNESADKWARSRLNLAAIAIDKWLKPVANLSGGGYDYEEPIADYDAPDWSKFDFDKAIAVACKDRIIVDMEHDAVKEALGL
ncbi:hypothetical protein CKO51_13245 [Rhodopirellula sp. SM50]|nr:hypothetical protein CKO51_13245 [Rhodopirellula sp. SM50]